MIIGANEFQNPLILKAKEKGYETHVFAWECGDIGEKTADFFYPISIVEKETILEKCKEINPDGVISIGSDLASVTVNYIANELGLIGNSLKSALLSTNKHMMRNAFDKAGIPSPKSILFEGDSNNILIHDMQFPLIVKPTDRSGSRGIYKVWNKEELTKAVDNAKKESFEKKVLIEEFAEGTEYSVEFISYRGEHKFLAITRKFTTGSPRFIETGHMQPAELSLEIKEKVISVVKNALDSLEIKNGASHSEIKIDENENIKVIEIGGRMGGDCIGSDLVKLSTGYDFVDLVIDVACGKSIELNKMEEKYAFIKFIFSKSDLDMIKQLNEKYGNYLVRYSVKEIDSRKEVKDSSQRFGFYIWTTKDKEVKEEMIRILQKSSK